MHFSTLVTLSIIACASSTIAQHHADSSFETRTEPSLTQHAQQLPNELKVKIGDHMYEGAKSKSATARYREAGVPQSEASRKKVKAVKAHEKLQKGVNDEVRNGNLPNAGEGLRRIVTNNRRLRRSSLETRTEPSLQENFQKLPNELKTKVGDHMYEGAKSKSATARYRETGVPQSETSRQKVKAVKAHEKLQKGVNEEVRNGNLPNAGEGLRRIVTSNRRLRRSSLETRTEPSLQENFQKLPNELKTKVGDHMYEGAKSKSATARYREAGVPQSEVSRQKVKAVKAHEKLQKGVNEEVRNGNLPNAREGLRGIVTNNRRLRRAHGGEDLELVLRDIVDRYYANL